MQVHLNYIRSSLSIKVIGLRSRSYEKKTDNFTYFNLLVLCIWLQVINKVKVTHQGEGHIKVREKYLYPFQFLCSPYCQQVGGLHSTVWFCDCIICTFYIWS